MTPQDMEVGKTYFCQYTAVADPNQFPLLAGEDVPITTITGIGQILQRDLDNQVCEVIDLQSHQRYVVSFEDMVDIAEAD